MTEQQAGRPGRPRKTQEPHRREIPFDYHIGQRISLLQRIAGSGNASRWRQLHGTVIGITPAIFTVAIEKEYGRVVESFLRVDLLTGDVKIEAEGVTE
jgi:hypothetical protein